MTTGAEREHHLSGVPKDARPFQGRPAGIVTRLLANAVDVIVVIALIGVGLLMINGALLAAQPLTFEPFITPLPITLAAGVVVAILYLGTSWATTGRTVGNAVLGVRVVDAETRSRLKPARALIRAATCTVFAIGLAWALVGRDGRSLHDRLVGSAVLYQWSVG